MDEKRTDKDARLLHFIVAYSSVHGYPPTTREIATAIGVASTCIVAFRLRRLEREGRIHRTPRVSRGLVVPATAQQVAH